MFTSAFRYTDRGNTPNSICWILKKCHIFLWKILSKCLTSCPILLFLRSDYVVFWWCFVFIYTESLCHVNAASLSVSIYKYSFYFYVYVSIESLSSIFFCLPLRVGPVTLVPETMLTTPDFSSFSVSPGTQVSFSPRPHAHPSCMLIVSTPQPEWPPKK